MPLARHAIQNPAYRPADTSNGGSAEKPPGPRQFLHGSRRAAMREHHGEQAMLGTVRRSASGVMLVEAAMLGNPWPQALRCSLARMLAMRA
jgi:hypothetical protein